MIAVFLLLAGALLALAGTGWLPGYLALAVGAAAGFGQGLAGPSRDMLIKQAAPPGATGRVYGTVYSGLDLGFSVAAPIFGWLMDHQQPQGFLRGGVGAGGERAGRRGCGLPGAATAPASDLRTCFKSTAGFYNRTHCCRPGETRACLCLLIAFLFFTVSYASETRRRRTFAIISHPDAGKTTLTEKLLLFSGAIRLPGR